VFNDRKQIFVKQRISVMKLTSSYELIDPETQQIIGEVKDEPSGAMKFLRLLVNKLLLPTKFNFYASGNPQPVLSLVKAGTFFRQNLSIHGQSGQPLAKLQTKFGWKKMFSLMGPNGEVLGEVKSADWKAWNFQICDQGGQEIGLVTKKWAGFAKEFLTQADNYLVSVTNPAVPNAMPLLLATGIALDAVMRDHK
jgi:Scramblase